MFKLLLLMTLTSSCSTLPTCFVAVEDICKESKVGEWKCFKGRYSPVFICGGVR